MNSRKGHLQKSTRRKNKCTQRATRMYGETKPGNAHVLDSLSRVKKQASELSRIVGVIRSHHPDVVDQFHAGLHLSGAVQSCVRSHRMLL